MKGTKACEIWLAPPQGGGEGTCADDEAPYAAVETQIGKNFFYPCHIRMGIYPADCKSID